MGQPMTKEEFICYILALAIDLVFIAVTYITLSEIVNGDFKSFKSARLSERNKNDEQINGIHDDHVDRDQSS